MGDPERAWTDLAGNLAGEQVTREAARRRRVEGAGADRSWRLGAEGEQEVAEAVSTLTVPSRWDRLRHRDAGWWVLHSVPVGAGTTDIDHVLGGPPGVFTINTKHHRTRLVETVGDEVLVDRYPTRYVEKALYEAARATILLDGAIGGACPELAAKLRVRPVLVMVGARLVRPGRPGGVIVTTPARLALLLREMPAELAVGEVRALHTVARRSTTWTG